MKGESNKVRTIKQLLEKGQYRIDPHVIADAIINWPRMPQAPAPTVPEPVQKSCSNPYSPSSPSVKTIPGGPSTTDPMRFTSAPWTWNV